MRHLSQDIDVRVVHRKVAKETEGESIPQEEGDDINPDIISEDTEVATEGLGKLWKKFKIWFTEGNKNAVENIDTYFKFITEECTDADVAEVCKNLKVSGPDKKGITLINNTAITVLDLYGKEFSRIQKTGSFLNAYKHDSDKGFSIPECSQFISAWKPIGVELSFHYDYKFLAILNFKEYNKRYDYDGPEKSFVKQGIASIKDLEELVNLIHNTDKFMKNFYSSVAKQMVNTSEFPDYPKGLTLTKSEHELSKMNFIRALGIRNASVEAFDITTEMLGNVYHVFKRIKSAI